MNPFKKTSAEYWHFDSLEKNFVTEYNPILYNGYKVYRYWIREWTFVHTEYDGAPDAKDHRYGMGKSLEDCLHQINEKVIDEILESSTE